MSESSRKQLRKRIAIIASGRCEYCRVLEYLSHHDFHIEHIIGIQHGGTSTPSNLAYSCAWCNWKKCPNIATILEDKDILIPLFNPRKQNWFSHFEADETGFLLGKTAIGKATIKLLELNHAERVEERKRMMVAGFYP
ncbi:MAG: HNH endonuclease [Saprospiraceae bacterium]|nr:HNH endonuclease [Saprospiraceae bacterium]